MYALTNEETLSIIVPAHDEAQVIGRLLGQLVTSADEGELDIVVVTNGCTDNTTEVAASFGPPVRVVSISAASTRVNPEPVGKISGVLSPVAPDRMEVHRGLACPCKARGHSWPWSRK